jgi:hypothetical protein
MQNEPKEEKVLQWLNARWQGVLPDGRFIWMNDDILQEYVYGWVLKHMTHEGEPSEEQLWDARQYCRQVSFWVGIADARIDARIYIEPRPNRR